jgi:histidinol dehydrogenase
VSALRRLRLSSPGGERWLARLRARGRQVLDRRVEAEAARIVREVRRGGDAALLSWISRLEPPGRGVAAGEPLDASAGVAALRLDPGAGPAGALPAGFAGALETAIAAVERFHRPQVAAGYRIEDDGMVLEERRQPLARIGVYVPGGRAVYVSTVVMTVVPARLAGVGEIVVATPAQAWRTSAALRHTAARLGVRELWTIGGAQAIAALAFGTQTLRPVDKIVGPGNAWVAAAKRRVSAEVAIDGVAGPSEVVIFAGDEAPAEVVAADLLAQAEHDPRAAAVLITTSPALARRVGGEVERQLEALASREVARAALDNFGAALLADGVDQALAAIESLAPEHLQLIGAEPEAQAGRVRNAGAIFVGAAAGEVFGDYVAGPSHVLPTCGTARFASALGVEDFVRRSHVVRLTAAAASRRAAAAAALAEVEGLPAHAAAARRRIA